MLAIELNITQILLNKCVYLVLSTLEISKIVMYEFLHDYVKLKYGETAKLCYMDTDSFIVYVKTEDIYVDIAKDVETRSDTSSYELERPLPKRKNKKVIGLMKIELDAKKWLSLLHCIKIKNIQLFNR